MLRDIIQEKGYKHEYIAKQLQITRACFSQKINGLREFKASEIKTVTEVLGLNSQQRDKIFFDF